MVDDINFPKGMPPVSASGRVQRVNRKKRKEERQPFEKFFAEEDQEDQEDKKKKRRKRESDKVEIQGKTKKRTAQNDNDSSNSTDPAEEQGDSDKKIIDVRV